MSVDTSRVFTVTLPLPPRECWPNRMRTHWRIRHEAARQARYEAMLAVGEAIKARWTQAPMWEECVVTVTFIWPDRRKRDLDGALGALKPALDGITDAALWTDDSAIVELRMRAEVDKANAGVRIEVREVTDGEAG